MASEQSDAVFREEDLDDDDETLEDEEEEDDDDDVTGEPEEDEETEPSPSISFALAAVPVSVVSNGDSASIPSATIDAADSSEPKRTEKVEEKKALEDSRRLFQRLWTDEDEIGLLQGFLEYTAQRGSSHHNDTALFYDQIKSKLQLGFNKNQLVEKLRRLKKKYRNVLNKISSGKEFSFKSPHDQATFEISRKIWSHTPPIGAAAAVEDDDEINPNPNPNFGHHSMSSKNEAMTEKKTPPSRKRSRSGIKTEESALNKNNNCISNNNNDDDDDNNHNYSNSKSRHSNNIQGLIEETVRSCLSPLLKELVSSAMGSPFGFGGRGFGVGGFTLNPMPMPLSLLNMGSGEMMVDEKWRKQQILELQVYAKRLELAQDEIKVALEELRSAGAGG